MGSTEIVVQLEQRETVGKGLGDLRRQQLVPGVIHDHGNPSVHVQASAIDLLKAYRRAGKNHPVELNVGDKKFLALIKDANFKPPKHRLQHIVFQAIKQNETVEAEVPIEFSGTAPAERVGLVVLRQLDAVQIEALPKDLPDHFTIDAEKLVEAGDKITVADLVVPSGVTILTEPEHTIATVVEPRAVAAQEAEDEAGESTEAASSEEPATQD